MRLKIVGYWGRDRMDFECRTDNRRHYDNTIDVSMFDLMRAAGFDSTNFTDEQAKSLVGKEFEVGGLIPARYLCWSTPKLCTDEKWKDMGEDFVCKDCGARYCECGSAKPIAA